MDGGYGWQWSLGRPCQNLDRRKQKESPHFQTPRKPMGSEMAMVLLCYDSEIEAITPQSRGTFTLPCHVVASFFQHLHRLDSSSPNFILFSINLPFPPFLISGRFTGLSVTHFNSSIVLWNGLPSLLLLRYFHTNLHRSSHFLLLNLLLLLALLNLWGVPVLNEILQIGSVSGGYDLAF